MVMKLLGLRLALHQQPPRGSETWLQLYYHLNQALTRLDTLAELARWQESPATPAAHQYQQSLPEAAEIITYALDQQITVAPASTTA
ncbi:MAG: hypothetical protein ACRYG7_10505 [Janthinobacterium lividum]